MASFFKTIVMAAGVVASVTTLSTANAANGFDGQAPAEQKMGVLQNAAYSGITCEHVRAKVAESGVVATYAYARYMGLTARDIAKVRKACSV